MKRRERIDALLIGSVLVTPIVLPMRGEAAAFNWTYDDYAAKTSWARCYISPVRDKSIRRVHSTRWLIATVSVLYQDIKLKEVPQPTRKLTWIRRLNCRIACEHRVENDWITHCCTNWDTTDSENVWFDWSERKVWPSEALVWNGPWGHSNLSHEIWS